MKLAPYPKYKDSGVSWLGTIPMHWDLKPGFAFLSERKEKNIGMKESTVLSLSYGQIIIKPPEKLHGLVPESFETYQIADPGNIIIRGTDLQNDKTSLRVGKVRKRGIITSAYLCLQTNEKISPGYTHLLLHGYDLKKVYYGMGSGLRQNLDYSDFKRLPILVPTETEQSKIHKYVESISAQINKFIRNKRRLIELLKEQKQNIFNQAVTRGLSPNVKLKPSSVEWIEDIPEHWEVWPLTRSVVDRADYRGATPEKVEAGVVLITAKNVRMGWIDYEISREYVDKNLYLEIMRRGLPKIDDLLLTMEAPLGHAALVDHEQVAFAQRVVRFRMNPVLFRARFVLLSVLSQYVQDQLLSRGTGSTALGIKASKLPQIRLFKPSLKEQDEILTYIDEVTKPIDTAIARAEREIELMREYRTRLITDVVTGQVDVRGIEVPEVAEEELLAMDEEAAEADEMIDDEGDMDEAV